MRERVCKMEQPQLTDEQKEYINEQMLQGEAFNGMIRDRGWEYVKKYYETLVQAFATEVLTSDKDIKEFESKRREIMGIKKLMGFINSCIQTYSDGVKPKGTAEE